MDKNTKLIIVMSAMWLIVAIVYIFIKSNCMLLVAGAVSAWIIDRCKWRDL